MNGCLYLYIGASLVPDLDVHETVKTVTDGSFVVVKRYSPSSDLWGAVPPGTAYGVRIG